MTSLAINGGKPAVSGKIETYDTIGSTEIMRTQEAMIHGPLSGYLGGERKGGHWVEKLETEWCKTFDVKHAIAVNSATSGLLAACVAAGVKAGDQVITTPYTMSATAAAPKVLGAEVLFADIELSTYCIHDIKEVWREPRTIIATNLFGHPAELTLLRKNRAILIEDNAQAPFAMENLRYTGTIGHIGVFSLNCHKHFQAGEGGICVTNNDGMAEVMRLFRNHGEMAGGLPGLNLRMTETTAAIACAQLARGRDLVNQRIEIAEQILEATKDIPGVQRPVTREHCRHVYYCLPFWVENNRDWFVDALAAEGVPLQKGYVKPLYHLNAFRVSFTRCPNAELAYKHVALWENCAHSPTSEQIKQFGEAFRKVADYANQRAQDRAGGAAVRLCGNIRQPLRRSRQRFLPDPGSKDCWSRCG